MATSFAVTVAVSRTITTFSSGAATCPCCAAWAAGGAWQAVVQPAAQAAQQRRVAAPLENVVDCARDGHRHGETRRDPEGAAFCRVGVAIAVRGGLDEARRVHRPILRGRCPHAVGARACGARARLRPPNSTARRPPGGRADCERNAVPRRAPRCPTCSLPTVSGRAEPRSGAASPRHFATTAVTSGSSGTWATGMRAGRSEPDRNRRPLDRHDP